ncbi:hypothetical protein AFLA_012990 [Aspergillus flavus NRRL3357]|nr:hypothetical protein AFLA_012990 [Aspergillus flavus NRRL3357]
MSFLTTRCSAIRSYCLVAIQEKRLLSDSSSSLLAASYHVIKSQLIASTPRPHWRRHLSTEYGVIPPYITIKYGVRFENCTPWPIFYSIPLLIIKVGEATSAIRYSLKA